MPVLDYPRFNRRLRAILESTLKSQDFRRVSATQQVINPPATTTWRSLYILGMEHQATRAEILAILEGLDPAEVPTMIRAVRVMLEAGWMSETEAMKWRQLMHALTDCSPGDG